MIAIGCAIGAGEVFDRIGEIGVPIAQAGGIAPPPPTPRAVASLICISPMVPPRPTRCGW
jgi:hypothetical protein